MNYFELGPKPILYVIILRKVAGKELTKNVITRHIDHIRSLDDNGQLVLCGPFQDHPSGAVVVKAKDKSEAVKVASQDPFVIEGFRTFEVRTWEIGNKENNYLA